MRTVFIVLVLVSGTLSVSAKADRKRKWVVLPGVPAPRPAPATPGANPAACATTRGCNANSVTQCAGNPLMCDNTDDTMLTNCYLNVGTTCQRADGTLDCACPPGAATQTPCVTTRGCNANSQTQCAGNPLMCDNTDDTMLTDCYLNVGTTCLRAGGTLDCDCAPGAATLPACATIMGCVTGTSPAACDQAGNTQCNIADATMLVACHSPPADNTCTPVPAAMDCSCPNPDCATVRGCTATSQRQCAGNPLACDTSDDAMLADCYAINVAPNCNNPVAGTDTCAC